MSDRARKLEEHLSVMEGNAPNSTVHVRWYETIAAGILADPQAHIDALVEAGVLRRGTGQNYTPLDGAAVTLTLPALPAANNWLIVEVQLYSL